MTSTQNSRTQARVSPSKQDGETQTAYARRFSVYLKGLNSGSAGGNEVVMDEPPRALSRADLARVKEVRADLSDLNDPGHVKALIDGHWVRLPDQIVPEAWKNVSATPRTPADLSGGVQACGGAAKNRVDMSDDDRLAELMAEHYGPALGESDPVEDAFAGAVDRVYGGASTMPTGADSTGAHSKSPVVDDDRLADIMDQVYGSSSC